MKLNDVPINVLYHDKNILVVQTLAYSKADSTEHLVDNDLSAEMLSENKPSFGKFNLGLHVDDEPCHVLDNRCQLINKLNELTDNKKVKQIHWLNQVHGNTVFDVDGMLDVDSILDENSEINITPPNADALTTLQQGQALAIMTADCVPITLYCQKTGRVAGIHAGWHGLANGVIAETVKAFADGSDDLNSHVDIQAWIGACISGENYEVSRDVLDKLVNGTLASFTKLDKNNLIEKITKPHKDLDKTWIDLPKLARIQLQQFQLETLNIQVLTDEVPCSYADTDYYSHRRATHKNQGTTGRMAMMIVKL